jgi:potassium/hydrogen antiporter
MSEIGDFGTVVLIVAAGIALALLSTRITDRIPVPTPAIFLGAAAAASDIWPTLYSYVPIKTVVRIAVVALIVILFSGGMDIGWRRFRSAAAPIVLLGIAGTFIAAAIVALVAHYALGFGWLLAGLVGAAVAPTDPAVMFAVLGAREIAGRSGLTLEGEAGVNDPAAIALMLGLIELETHHGSSFVVVIREFVVEISVGTAAGVIGAAVLIPLLRRLRLTSVALYPVLALVIAAALYGATSVARGSGFLAVFIAGLVVGNARLLARREIEAFHTSLAALAEVAVFVALGLTVRVTAIDAKVWLEGIVIALALACVARPAATFALLAKARFTRSELLFITWSGLKGAVPILLAAFALLAGVHDGMHIYEVVFVVVVVSVVGQGSLVPFIATRLRIPVEPRPELAR